MPGPPNKYFAFVVTNTMTIDEYAATLGTAYSNGYTGQPFGIPSPEADGSTWVAIPGY
jgi:hypothetical protein